MLKQIIIYCLIMLCFYSCNEQSKVKAFLDKYEFENFSQFNNVNAFIRGVDSENNPIVMINAPHWIYDTSRVGLYVAILDKKSNQIIKTKWKLTENIVDADTVKIQQLIQIFIKYRIPRLDVDTSGNVFVYLKDNETLTLARFVNNSEINKYNSEAWRNIKGNWYKPLYYNYNEYGKCFNPYTLPTFEQYLFDNCGSTTFDSIIVTYWNVYDHIFSSYKIIYIKEKKILYVEPETIKTAKRFYLRDSSVIRVFLDNINRYYVQNEKIIYHITRKKIEDWEEYYIPTFEVECFKNKKRLLFKYTKLEDGYNELEFSPNFVKFSKLIQLAIDLYDDLYTKSKY